METNSPNDSAKKSSLETLSKEDLIKRCERLLILAQKAKQAKDILHEENNELKNLLSQKDGNVSNELIENLTQQKLLHVTTIEDLKKQNVLLNSKLEKCEDKNNVLENENTSFKRQIKRLTDENEALFRDLELMEKEMVECKKLGLQQQSQLLELENSRQILEEANKKLQESDNSQVAELEKMLSISLEEVQKLQSENREVKEKIEDLKLNLSEKDKNILIISEELQAKCKLIENLEEHQKSSLENQNVELSETFKKENEDLKHKISELEEVTTKQKDRLKLYHSKIVKLAGNIKTVKENKNEILALFKSYTKQVEEWKSQLIISSQKLCDSMDTLNKENKSLKESNEKFKEQLKAHKTDDEKTKELNEIEDVRNKNTELNEKIQKLLQIQNEHQSKIEDLSSENDSLSEKLSILMTQLQDFDDQSKKDNIEIKNRKEENEKICIEYRKIISKLEEEIRLNLRELDELKMKNCSLQESLEHSSDTEKQIADKTSQEILKLVQENAELLETNQKLQEKNNKIVNQIACQTDREEDNTASLKRENSELLTEMNEMNQALKERGGTISKFQSHCEEIMKKLQRYETQANKNVDNISQKEETIKKLEQEIQNLKKDDKESEIAELKNEIESLREKLDSSYAESETMSTSTISRSDEVNRLKELEGSWEERYGKLRTLAVKLKSKVRDLSNELTKEQNEKNDIQQKLSSGVKTIATLQSQSDQLEDELETAKKQLKELEATVAELNRSKQKLAENEDTINKLKKEIEELNLEKQNTETWKKQISGKVQTFRKELEANKVVKKELEATVAKLTSQLEAKEQALKTESDCHQQTKNSLEHSNNERKKNSVLNLEMQDYERSVKELSQKLEKKQEEINKMKNQLESQKSTGNALREQNKLVEERMEEMKSEVSASQNEIITNKKQISELEEVVQLKESKIQDLTQLLETVRSENEELSTELSKVISEHQKVNNSLKSDKEHLRSQVLGLQQTLRETQDTLKLKEDELKIVQSDYTNYKVRAQSVLRQNQSRDVGLEEKITEELSALRVKYDGLESELKEYKKTVEDLRKENNVLSQEKNELFAKFEESSSEIEDLKTLYDQLSSKHQQTIIEHGETVRSLKVHAETLAQCYRQQLSEQEVRHNREIIELQSKIEKAPSPTELPFPPLPTMPREEGEGSESTDSNNKNNMHPVPLERLLGSDIDQEVAFFKKQLSEEESKVIHLTALLADTEQDLAKHVQMNKLLKEEIRRQQRSVEREEHAENLEYLKNVVFKFVTLHSGDERSHLVPVLNTILKLSPEETQKLNMVARGDPGIKGWTNFLPLWSSSSKPS